MHSIASSVASSAPSASVNGSSRVSRSARTTSTSHHGRQSSASTRSLPRPPVPTDGEFHFPRPESDAELDRMFVKFLHTRGLDRRSVQSRVGTSPSKPMTGETRTDVPGIHELMSWSADKKWQLVHTQAFNEWTEKGRTMGERDRGSSMAPTNGPGSPNPSIGPSTSNSTLHSTGSTTPSSLLSGFRGRDTDTATIVSLDSSVGGSSGKGKGRADAPEDYLAQFMNNTITAKVVASLNVGLRTYPLSCVRSDEG